MSDAQATPATEPEDKVVYKLKLDLPYPNKGDSVQIVGLGTFENGATHDITESQHAQFQVQNATFENNLNENNEVTGATQVPGPTLEEAVETIEGATVTSGTTASKKGGKS